jgi:hypothetical protein
MCDAFLIQFDNITVDKTVPASSDTVDLQSVIYSGTDYRANAWIHAGCVAAAGKYTDPFDLHRVHLVI